MPDSMHAKALDQDVFATIAPDTGFWHRTAGLVWAVLLIAVLALIPVLALGGSAWAATPGGPATPGSTWTDNGAGAATAGIPLPPQR
jgi:hypothetical protein